MLNTASTGLGNVWAMAVTLASLPLLLHGLGAAAFGTWVLLQTFSAVNGWFSLADAGAGTATTRLVAEHASLGDRQATRVAISSGMVLFLILGAVAALLIGIVGPFVLPALFNTPDDLVHSLKIAVVFFAAQAFVEFVTEGIEACLEGVQRVDLSRAVDAVRRTFVAAAACVAANVSGSLSTVAAASCAGSLAGLLAAFVAIEHVGHGLARPSRAQIHELFRYGRTVALLRPLGVLHRTMDRTIVGAIIGPEAVALVEIATQVQTGAEAVLSASSYAVVPSASWLHARGDKATLRELLELGTKYSLLATSAVVAVGMVLAAPFVHVWVSDRYQDAAGLAVVALLFVAVTAPLQVGSNILLGIGRAGDILKAALLAVVINLAASIVLVHLVGVVGCFIGSLLGTVALIPILGRATLDAADGDVATFLRRSVVPALLPTAALVVIGLAVVALPLNDLLTVALGAILSLGAYLLVAVRLSVSRQELQSVRESFARG